MSTDESVRSAGPAAGTTDAAFEELVARVRDGDERAADELVQRYEPEIRRFVRYRLTDPLLRRFLDSQDISQSVFARFFVQLSAGRIAVESPRQLAALLLTMVGNRLRDHVRRQNAEKRTVPATGWVPLDTVIGKQPDPAESVASSEFVENFRRRLTDDERDILDMRLCGESWGAVAERAGVSSEAARKRLSRGVDRVAQELGLA